MTGTVRSLAAEGGRLALVMASSCAVGIIACVALAYTWDVQPDAFDAVTTAVDATAVHPMVRAYAFDAVWYLSTAAAMFALMRYGSRLLPPPRGGWSACARISTTTMVACLCALALVSAWKGLGALHP